MPSSTPALNESELYQLPLEDLLSIDLGRFSKSEVSRATERTQGVAVRRLSGLGSDTRFTANGFFDYQIRFSLEGVPLEALGFPVDLSSVPLNWLSSVQLERGVIPLRLGAHVLGAAVDLVPLRDPGLKTSASYEFGSFSTHRLSASGRYQHAETGLTAALAGFFQRAKNDYGMLADVPNAQGQLERQKVRRFHDGYGGQGGSLELGVVDAPWIRRLSAHAYVSNYDKELQHNIAATVPYGEALYSELNYGGTLRYEQKISDRLELSAWVNHNQRAITFLDVSTRVYNWFGEVVQGSTSFGERQSASNLQTLRSLTAGQFNALWHVVTDHALRLNVSPSYAAQRADDRLTNASAPYPAIFSIAFGLEYELKAFRLAAHAEGGEKNPVHLLENALFAKGYGYGVGQAQGAAATFAQKGSPNLFAPGVGDRLKLNLRHGWSIKASYEWSARLPHTDEVYGNGVLVQPNLSLDVERTHALNVVPRLERKGTIIGDVFAEVNGFARWSTQYIALLGYSDLYQSVNIDAVRTLGGEGSVGWSSPGGWASLETSATLQDVRVTAERDAPSRVGSRAPNRPWFFGAMTAKFHGAGLIRKPDDIDAVVSARYTHPFSIGWESSGILRSEDVVPAQITLDTGLSYTARIETLLSIILAAKVENVTDAQLYDLFRIPRPGRTFSLKLTIEH